MQRRPFLKLLGVTLGGFPLFSGVAHAVFSDSHPWQDSLAQLLEVCPITSQPIPSLPSSSLPTAIVCVKSNEFTSADPHIFFYQHKAFCFQIFQKVHETAGLLDLAIPFWKKTEAGTWEVIACLSLAELHALAKAAKKLKSATVSRLFPIEKSKAGRYRSTLGDVHLSTHLTTNKQLSTTISLKNNSTTLWNSTSLF